MNKSGSDLGRLCPLCEDITKYIDIVRTITPEPKYLAKLRPKRKAISLAETGCRNGRVNLLINSFGYM